jgi:sugar phosphate isomerase/epimerase
MFWLSCFADEISADLNVQIDFLLENKIRFVDLRGVWDKNILDLTEEELGIVREKFIKNNIRVSAIASPIGKSNITEDFSITLEKLSKAIQIAKFFDTRYIRVFSFYIPKERIDQYQDQVVIRFREMARRAQDSGIVLIHENDAGLYGETSSRSRYLLESVNSQSLKAVFDPSNFVIAGEEPLEESFPELENYIKYMHVKDSVRGTGQIVMAGKGDGRIKELLSLLKDREDFFVSLEPHLDFAGEARGFTGSALFKMNLDEFKGMMTYNKFDYR